jgi:hypothetical protein
MKYLFLPAVIFFTLCVSAQNTEYATYTFKDTRLINGQTIENTPQGTGTFIISHRFGDIYQNNATSILYDFFGFSGGANMRIGMDYGIKDCWEIGAGRSNLDKTYDLFTKVRIVRQSKGDKNFPFTLSAYGDIAIVTDTSNALLDSIFVDRLSYTSQLLLARKFSERFSLQLMPTFVHRNLVGTAAEKNDVLSIGAAVRFQLSDRIALNGEYYYTLPDQLPAGYDNSTALGIDITTKGHVFQLQLTNSPYLIPAYYIGKTSGEIVGKDANGDFDLNLRFGFNISRNFKIAGRQY